MLEGVASVKGEKRNLQNVTLDFQVDEPRILREFTFQNRMREEVTAASEATATA